MIKTRISTYKPCPFVDEIEEITIKSWYFPAYHVFNLFIRMWRLIGGTLGFLSERPLPKSANPAFECKHHGDFERVVLFNLLNNTNSQVFSQYAFIMLTKLFPVVNANIYFFGNPSDERYNEISIVTYESHQASCELAESEIFPREVEMKRASVGEVYTHVTKRLF